MKTLSQEIMALDFRRVGKNYALAAAVVLVVCVGLGFFCSGRSLAKRGRCSLTGRGRWNGAWTCSRMPGNGAWRDTAVACSAQSAWGRARRFS